MKKSAIIISFLGMLIIVSCHSGFDNFNKRKYLDLKNKPKYVEVEEASKNISHVIPYNDVIEFPETNTAEPEIKQNTEQNKITNTQAEKTLEVSDESEKIISTKKFDSKKSRKTYDSKFVSKKIETKNPSDYLLYLLLPIIGLSAFGIIRISRKKTLQVTKWASKNKLKSRFIIAGIQTCIGAIGLGIGNELSLSGYTFSDSLQYISGGIMTIAFIGLFFQKKIETLKSFYLSRIGHLVIGISFLGLTIGTGNGLTENLKPVSVIGYSVDYFGGDYFENVSQADEPEAPANYSYSVGLIILFVLLTLVLIAGMTYLCCAAFCEGGPSLGVPVVILCAALLSLIIWGMVEAVKKTAVPK